MNTNFDDMLEQLADDYDVWLKRVYSYRDDNGKMHYRVTFYNRRTNRVRKLNGNSLVEIVESMRHEQSTLTGIG